MKEIKKEKMPSNKSNFVGVFILFLVVGLVLFFVPDQSNFGKIRGLLLIVVGFGVLLFGKSEKTNKSKKGLKNNPK